MQLNRLFIYLLLLAPMAFPMRTMAQLPAHIPVFEHLSPAQVLERGIKRVSINGKAWYDFETPGARGYQDFRHYYEFDKEGRLIKEVTTGEPGSKLTYTYRHLYAGDQLKQTEEKVGTGASTYTYYTYDDEKRLTRIESKAANIAFTYLDDGTIEIETLNHKHDYPALREEKYDSAGHLVYQKDYRKSGLKKPVLFKISRFEYDSTGRKTTSLDSTLRSVEDLNSWNLYSSTYDHDALGRVTRQTNKIVLFGEDYLDEKSMIYGADGLNKVQHCSPPGWPPCKESFSGFLENMQGQMILEFEGDTESAKLTQTTWNEEGLLDTRKVEDGKLELEGGLYEMPIDPLEEIWWARRIWREEAFSYEYFK